MSLSVKAKKDRHPLFILVHGGKQIGQIRADLYSNAKEIMEEKAQQLADGDLTLEDFKKQMKKQSQRGSSSAQSGSQQPPALIPQSLGVFSPPPELPNLMYNWL